MKLKIGSKEFDLIDCTDFYSRFKGFMFTKNIDHCLRFSKCNSIHTFFMLSDIDVVMTDKDNNVLFVYRKLKPWRVISPKKGVYNVYELPSGSVSEIDKIIVS